MTTRKLVLIDGHALAYRMFFALPLEAFTTKSGEPYMSNDAMESHLFHNVYGDRLGNSTVFDECYPVLIDGDWYWQE